MVSFTIMGKPKAKQRHGFNRKTGRAFPKEETVNFENLVKLSYRQVTDHFFEGSVKMTITVYMAIPKSASKKQFEAMMKGCVRPTKKPDLDNVGKSIADGLNTVAYHDDSCITTMILRKVYHNRDFIDITLEDDIKDNATIHGWV